MRSRHRGQFAHVDVVPAIAKGFVILVRQQNTPEIKSPPAPPQANRPFVCVVKQHFLQRHRTGHQQTCGNMVTAFNRLDHSVGCGVAHDAQLWAVESHGKGDPNVTHSTRLKRSMLLKPRSRLPSYLHQKKNYSQPLIRLVTT